MTRALKVVVLFFLWLSVGLFAQAENGYRYQGKTPEEWLIEVVNYTNQSAALYAFQQMGTNAHPALLSALVHCDSKLHNLYANKYPQLPAFVRTHLSRPMKAKDIEFAVSSVLLNSDSRPLLAKALKLLEDASPEVRYTIVSGLQNKVRSSDAELAPSFERLLTDTNSHTRVSALHCLQSIGPGASSQTNGVIGCLSDTVPSVRVTAAYTLWTISGETNRTVPVLRSALSQSYPVRHWAACYLLNTMDRSTPPPPDLIPVFIGSLEQRAAGVQISACYCLLRYGADAKAAVPQLLKLLQSTNSEVRTAAERCLKKVAPESVPK